jgi:hypothetical protein
VHAPQSTPVVDAKPDDVADLLGGALFKALYKWMIETGPVYLLPTGPFSSFLVISDPAAARHVLQRSDNPKDNYYNKGLVQEVSEFLFGSGFATAGVCPSCRDVVAGGISGLSGAEKRGALCLAVESPGPAAQGAHASILGACATNCASSLTMARARRWRALARSAARCWPRAASPLPCNHA